MRAFKKISSKLILAFMQIVIMAWASSAAAGIVTANPSPPNPCPDGGCCSSGGGTPGYGSNTGFGPSGPEGIGMPVVLKCDNVHVALNIKDTPLLNTAAIGPSTEFTIRYYSKSRAEPVSTPASHIGPIWRHNWQAWINDNPSTIGNNVRIYWRDGGYWPYTGYIANTGKFTREDTSQSQLNLVSIHPIIYERHNIDGGFEIYGHTRSNRTSTHREVLISAVVDPQGNRVNLFYDEQDRLEKITDATGRVSHFFYEDTANQDLITQIQDFSGRKASFSYTTSGELASVTDVAGMTSTFEYGARSIMTAMTTPYGTTRFVSTGDTDAHRTLTITDPMGGVERYAFFTNAPGLPYSVPSAEVPSMPQLTNAYINARNTFYWDKSTMVSMGGTIDYNKAYIRHWTHDIYGGGRPGQTIESEKRVGQSRIWYRYQGQNAANTSSKTNLVTMTGRKLADGTNLLQNTTYNTLGKPTSFRDENGNTRTITYAANQIDPLTTKVTASDGRLIWSESRQYNSQRRPTLYTDGQGNTTSYSYNTLGLLERQINPDATQLTYTYDVDGQLTRVTDTAGGITTMTWDNVGRMASIKDPRGLTKTYSYDNLNRITRIQYSDATSETYVWDKLDLVSHTDRYGRTSTYEWDANRRLSRSTNALGITSTYAYDPDGRITQLITPAGSTTYTYDAGGNLSSVKQPSGYQVTYLYDWAGRITQVIDNRGNRTHLVLDGTGNVVEETLTDAQSNIALKVARHIAALNLVSSQTVGGTQTTSYTYDNNTSLSTQTNAAETYQYRYDPMRRLSAIVNPLNAQLSLQYSANGALTKVEDFKGVATDFERNVMGDALKETSEDIGQLQSNIDMFGHSVFLRDTTGRSQTITRNAFGQPTQIRYADNTSSTILYDSAALLTRIQDPSVQTSFTRDYLKRLNSKNQTITLGGRQFTHTVGYDWTAVNQAGANMLRSVTYPSGKSVNYRYDATGQLIAVGLGQMGLAVNLAWSPLGMPTSWTFPFAGSAVGNPLTARRQYNSAGQLIESEIASYSYDQTGRLIQVTQQLKAPAQSGNKMVSQDFTVTNTISYNANGRVESFTQLPSHMSFTAGSNTWPVQALIGPLHSYYQWDANGNLNYQQNDGSFTGITAGLRQVTRTFATGSNNRTQSVQETIIPNLEASQSTFKAFNWDASGRMTSYQDNQLQLTWNAAGQLATSQGHTKSASSNALTSYVTNLMSQRVGMQTGTTGTITIYGDDAAFEGLSSYPLATYMVNTSTGAVTSQAEYFYLPTAQGPMPIAVHLDNMLVAVHTDHLNTPRRLSSNATTAVWQWPLSALGDVEPGTSVTGWIPNRLGYAGQIGPITAARFDLRYPGQQQDEATGLFYNHHRYYDPYLTAGYTQADPIGLEGGWNRFSYVGGNPLGGVDPRGLFSISIEVYLGIGAGLNISAKNGTLEITGRFGAGLGGGFAFDQNGSPSQHAKPCGSGYIARTTLNLSAGVGVGPISYAPQITLASGNAFVDKVGGGYSSYTISQFGLGANKNIGVRYGGSLGVEFGSYTNW